MIGKLVYIMLVGILGLAFAQDQIPSKDELLQKVPELGNLPGFAEFNASAIDTKEAEKLIKEKCEKNGGPTAFATAKESAPYFTNCLQSLVNVTQLQNEMEAARPRGELDVVFTKYCKKIPTLKNCIRRVTNSIEPCLEAEERESISVIHNITSSLLQFICDNEGDRIAMFIAGGGRECFSNKSQEIQNCANETFHSYIPTNNPAEAVGPGLAQLPNLVLGIEECTDMERFQQCAVNVLEKCADPTPANVLDSLMNFVKKVTPCQNLLRAQTSANTDYAGKANTDDAATLVNVSFLTVAMLLSLKFV